MSQTHHTPSPAQQTQITQNQKSVALAALVIVLLLLTIWFLARGTDETNPAANGPRSSLIPATAARHEQRQNEPASLNKEAPPHNTRIAFAARLNDRFELRHQSARVSTLGEEHRTLRFSWPEREVDRRHLSSLKKAEPLYRELRGRGFTRLELQVGDRVTWHKEL